MALLGLFDLLIKGGWVAIVLAGLSFILWYALGLRFLFLKEQSRQNVKDFGDEHRRFAFVATLSLHRQTIQSIVIVAPLLGLLGTVIGMIETFESLQDAALFSQSGGIAGGISQALITTQMGLVVAIPGLLMGRKLDKQQNEIEEKFLEGVHGLNLTGGVQ